MPTAVLFAVTSASRKKSVGPGGATAALPGLTGLTGPHLTGFSDCGSSVGFQSGPGPVGPGGATWLPPPPQEGSTIKAR